MARKVRRFVGMISFYHRFISHFSKLSAPLTDLTRKRQKFKWTAEAQSAFDILKFKLSEPPILIHPDFNKEFILTTDSSDHALGAFLGQKDESGIIRPIAYFSKKLNNAQKRYIILEKELLAIVEAVKSFKYYLYGRSFTIRCDNATLTKISNWESPGNRVARWLSYLADYNPRYELIKSSQNQIADTLSRDFYVNTVQIDMPTLDEIKLAQREDEKLMPIIHNLENSVQQTSHTPYFLSNGLLLRTAYIPRSGKSTKISQIVVPTKYKPYILAANHLSHFGFLKTYQAIREKYFWDNMYKETKHYVDSCKYCTEYRSPNRIPPVPLQRNFIATRPMQLISCDFIGKLPTTSKGNCYILTFVDHFTKFIHLYAVPNQTARTTAEKLLDFICIFGCPEFILTDRGTNFLSDVFRNLCAKFGITKLQTTALHPQTNGMSEKLNLNIKKSLSIFARDNSQWDEYLNYYSLIYNNSFHSAIDDKPAYLHLAYDPLLPTDILNSTPIPEYTSYTDFVMRKTAQIQYTYEKVRESLIKAAERQETYQARSAEHREFYDGQLVYLYSPDTDRNANLPKRRNYIGPMRIIHCHNNKVNYTIQNPSDPKAKPIKVHINRLIPYVERRSELDLLHRIVRADTQTKESNLPDSVLEKPHASFGEVLDTDLLPPTPQIHSTPKIVHTQTQLGPNNASDFTMPVNGDSVSSVTDQCTVENCDSDNTEIYEVDPVTTGKAFKNSSVLPTTSSSSTSHNYMLRSRSGSNFADKIFDWSLSLTK